MKNIKVILIQVLISLIGLSHVNAQENIDKGIIIKGNNDGGSPYILFRTLGDINKFGIQYWNDGLNFYRPGKPNSGDGTLFIDYSTGLIGIGTTSPKEKLSLSGPGAMLGIYDTNPASKANNRIGRYGNSLVIQNDLTGTWKDNVIFCDNGSVGIGTMNSQGYKLAVNGSICAKEVRVETDWADFVFEDDYQLRDLKEVESFIEENKHLPDIPSEKEVKEKGVNLGDMDAKLLQKIEELTLYVIQLSKENNEFRERLKKLETDN